MNREIILTCYGLFLASVLFFVLVWDSLPGRPRYIDPPPPAPEAAKFAEQLNRCVLLMRRQSTQSLAQQDSFCAKIFAQ